MSSVLVVEDDAFVADTLAMSLEDAGHVVYVAPDGSEGVLSAAIHHPDLIITDYRMPNANGLEMISKLRDEGVSVPIIMMTSEQEEQLPSTDGRSYDAFVQKPYLDKSMLDLIDELLKPVSR